MNDREKLTDVFVSTFGIHADEVPRAAFKVTKQWDSVGHVNLMSAIEETFDISLEPDDILDFRNYGIGISILRKYGVNCGCNERP